MIINVKVPDVLYIPSTQERISQGGNGSEDRFFSPEKVSLSAVVGKKDDCLTERSSCLPSLRTEVDGGIRSPYLQFEIYTF